MNSIESTGKSVDEAIYNGLRNMGSSIDEVTIEIIQQETKGILGIGAKPAIVRLTQRPPEEYEVPEYLRRDVTPKTDRFDRRDRRESRAPKDNRERREATESHKPRESREQRRESKQERNNAANKVNNKVSDTAVAANTPVVAAEQNIPLSLPTDKKADAPVNAAAAQPVQPNKPVIDTARAASVNNVSATNERTPKQNRNDPPRQRRQDKRPAANGESVAANTPAPSAAESAETAAPVTPTTPAVEYTLEAAKGNPAAEFVQGLIEHMGVEGQVLAAVEEDCLRMRIDTSTMGLLIGHRGETLDAMQYLTSLVINRTRKTDGYTRIALNTEDYREKREETLRRLAKKIASQVKATGRARALEPMNPYERRVLHATLQSHPFVSTHSEGEEPNRRVVVTPKRRSRQ